MKKVAPWPLVAAMAVVVAVLAGVLLLRDRGPSAADRLAAVPVAVDAAGSAHVAMTIELGGDDLDLTVEGAGAVELATGRGWFTISLLAQEIEMRTDGELLFVRPGGEEQWMATHADEVGDVGSFGAGPGEVVAFVDLLRDDLDDVEDLGETEVGDTAARHLRASIPRDELPGALARLTPDDGALPLEVWVDGRDLPVRQRITGRISGLDLVLTVDLSGWGDDLGVEIPPAGEIRDVEPEELERVFGAPATP